MNKDKEIDFIELLDIFTKNTKRIPIERLKGIEVGERAAWVPIVDNEEDYK